MRKALNGMKSEDAVEQILNMFTRTKNNAEFVQTVKKTEVYLKRCKKTVTVRSVLSNKNIK